MGNDKLSYTAGRSTLHRYRYVFVPTIWRSVKHCGEFRLYRVQSRARNRKEILRIRSGESRSHSRLRISTTGASRKPRKTTSRRCIFQKARNELCTQIRSLTSTISAVLSIINVTFITYVRTLSRCKNANYIVDSFHLQMRHPIQMKPADSENRNGEWKFSLSLGGAR